MRKPDETSVIFGEPGVGPDVVCPQSIGPDLLPILENVAVEERIGIRTLVMPAPTVGMKRRDSEGIRGARFACESGSRHRVPPGDAMDEDER